MNPSRSICGVFAGGGIKGIALAGAAAAGMDCGFHFRQILGTSSGALVGSLVTAGYSSVELRAAVTEIPWPDIADPVRGGRLPLVGKHVALVFGRGQNRGDLLERVWRKLLRAKGVRTFGDLPPGALRVVATDITHQRGVVIPDDLVRYGWQPERFSVARAVRMSSAVPFFFQPVPLHDLRGEDTALFVDGALTSNFPLRAAPWDGSMEVVGFRFALAEDAHQHYAIRGPASLAAAVVSAAIRASRTLDSPLLDRTHMIEVPVDRDPLDFSVSPEEAEALFDAGYSAAGPVFARMNLTAAEPAA